MPNRRVCERRKTFIGARIEQAAPFGTMDCIVRDLSDAGARLSFHNTASVTNRFSLVMPRKGRRVAARVVWRSFEACGVAFAGEAPEQVSGPLSPLALEERLRASETRRKALEARLERLNETG